MRGSLVGRTQPLREPQDAETVGTQPAASGREDLGNQGDPDHPAGYDPTIDPYQTACQRVFQGEAKARRGDPPGSSEPDAPQGPCREDQPPRESAGAKVKAEGGKGQRPASFW